MIYYSAACLPEKAGGFEKIAAVADRYKHSTDVFARHRAGIARTGKLPVLDC
jgi:hypothetical protein